MSERGAARLAGAAVLLSTLAACHTADAGAQRMRSTTSARQLQGETRANVKLEYGAGRLRVSPTRGDLLYRMELRYDDARFRPVSEYDRAAGRLRLGVESRENRGRKGGRDDQHATIELTPRVPLELSLAFGAGEADVELGGLALADVHLQTGASRTNVSFASPNRVQARRVKVEAGAAEVRVSGLGNTRSPRFEFSGGMGETTLEFGGTWTRSATARIDMGVGSVRLRLPRALGVRIVRDSFLSSFDAGGMVKRGNAWYSRNYEQARHKLDVSIHAAVGSIEVDWLD
jgi:hypothetical protein